MHHYFFPPPHSQPLTNPVIPPPCFFCSMCSSKGGNSTKLRAKSKKRGLQGMGSNSGGKVVKLGFLLARLGSSKYSSKRSANGCSKDKRWEYLSSKNVRREHIRLASQGHSSALLLFCNFFENTFHNLWANCCTQYTIIFSHG